MTRDHTARRVATQEALRDRQRRETLLDQLGPRPLCMAAPGGFVDALELAAAVERRQRADDMLCDVPQGWPAAFAAQAAGAPPMAAPRSIRPALVMLLSAVAIAYALASAWAAKDQAREAVQAQQPS